MAKIGRAASNICFLTEHITNLHTAPEKKSCMLQIEYHHDQFSKSAVISWCFMVFLPLLINSTSFSTKLLLGTFVKECQGSAQKLSLKVAAVGELENRV